MVVQDWIIVGSANIISILMILAPVINMLKSNKEGARLNKNLLKVLDDQKSVISSLEAILRQKQDRLEKFHSIKVRNEELSCEVNRLREKCNRLITGKATSEDYQQE